MDKLKNWIRENNDKMDIDVPNDATWDRLKKNLSKHSDSDQLKKYIAEKQDELQIEIPHAQSWNKISSSVKTKKPRHVYGIKRTLVFVFHFLLVFHQSRLHKSNGMNQVYEFHPLIQFRHSYWQSHI